MMFCDVDGGVINRYSWNRVRGFLGRSLQKCIHIRIRIRSWWMKIENHCHWPIQSCYTLYILVHFGWTRSRSVLQKLSSHRRNRSLDLLQLMWYSSWRAETGWHSALPFVLEDLQLHVKNTGYSVKSWTFLNSAHFFGKIFDLVFQQISSGSPFWGSEHNFNDNFGFD
jgi:hypothetical protein